MKVKEDGKSVNYRAEIESSHLGVRGDSKRSKLVQISIHVFHQQPSLLYYDECVHNGLLGLSSIREMIHVKSGYGTGDEGRQGGDYVSF